MLFIYVCMCVFIYLNYEGPSTDGAEDPIESASFIIRDRAPMVRGPY